MNVARPVAEKVESEIRRIVEETVGRFGVRGVEIGPGEDHDGDPVIYVDVEYGEEGDAVDPRVLAQLTTKIRERIWELGEQRFPLLRNRFPDHKAVVGYA